MDKRSSELHEKMLFLISPFALAVAILNRALASQWLVYGFRYLIKHKYTPSEGSFGAMGRSIDFLFAYARALVILVVV